MPSHLFSWTHLELNLAFFLNAQKLTKFDSFAWFCKEMGLTQKLYKLYVSLSVQLNHLHFVIATTFEREVDNEAPTTCVKHCWVEERV